MSHSHQHHQDNSSPFPTSSRRAAATNNSNNSTTTTTQSRLQSLQSHHNQLLNTSTDSIYQHLCATGQKETLKSLLRNRLLESGWMDKMQTKCSEELEKRGLQGGIDQGANNTNTTGEYLDIEALAKELGKDGVAMIPNDVKKDMERRLSSWIEKNMESE